MRDVDIYEFLVTQGGRRLMPNTQVNSFMTSFISPSARGNENKREVIEVFITGKRSESLCKD